MGVDSGDEERLLDLIALWEDHLLRGVEISLDELCVECPELKGELREKLEWLRRFDHRFARERGPVPPADAIALNRPGREVGRSFGRYEILEAIASGGMGEVYVAHDTMLNRRVALKLILPERLGSGESLRRFLGEAKAAASLRHPNIVRIFDIGSQEGEHYYSMEWIEGVDLASRLPELVGDHRAAATLLATVARAVEYANEHNILHRDLKPRNILLDREGTPYVADFGLAKRSDVDSDLTRTDAVMGTPTYMSPEQAEGKNRDLTRATDVYSLGVVLYELLVGHPPFRGETVGKTLQMVIRAEPVRPRWIDGRIPRDLETICLKCLEKSPRRRYPSAGELAADLDRWLRNEPIHARPVGRPERGWRWCQRNPAALLAAAVAASILVGMGVSAFFAYQSGQRARLAAQNRAIARQRFEVLSSISEAINNYSYNEFNISGRPVMGKAELRFIDGIMQVYREVVEEDAADPTRRIEAARGWRQLGEVLRLVGDAAGANQAFHQSLELLSRTEAGPDRDRERANTQHDLAILSIFKEPAHAEELLLRSREVFARLARDRPGDLDVRTLLIGTLGTLAILQERMNRPEGAERFERESLEIQEGLVRDAPDGIEYRIALARSYKERGRRLRDSDPGQASAAFRSSIDFLEPVLSASPTDAETRAEIADVLTSWGYTLQASKRIEEAERAHVRAHDLMSLLAKENPENRGYRDSLLQSRWDLRAVALMYDQRAHNASTRRDPGPGAIAKFEEDYRRTRALIEAALAVPAENSSLQHDLVQHLDWHGKNCHALGRDEHARAILEEAMSLRKSILEQAPTNRIDREKLVSTAAELSGLYCDIDRRRESARLWRETILALRKATGATPRGEALIQGLSQSYFYLAQDLERLGDHGGLAQLAEEMVRGRSADADLIYLSARALACAHRIVTDDDRPDDLDRRKVADDLAVRAITRLKQSVELALKTHAPAVIAAGGQPQYDYRELLESDDLRSLREIPEFKAWIVDLEAGGPPRRGAFEFNVLQITEGPSL